MNDKTKLGISLAVATGIVTHSLLDSIKIHRHAKAERQKIQANQDLDLTAIRRAGDLFAKEVKKGIYDHLNLGEQLAALNDRIEFERITIRMED